MSANTSNTSRTETAANIGKTQPQPGYHLRGKNVVAYLLEEGDELYLGHPKCPGSTLLVQGQHFDFTPPYRGRPGKVLDGGRDVLGTSKFVARVPLILAVHNPWPTVRGDGKLMGAQTIGHMRPARPGNNLVFIAGDRMKDNSDMFLVDLKYRLGCKDSGYSEQVVLGGPRGAVIYEDEIVIPGFNFVDGVRDNFPYTFIVENKDRDLITTAFRAGAKQAAQVRAGEAPKVTGVAVSGVLTTAQLGTVMVQYDRVFRVHRLTQYNAASGAHEPKLFVNFKNGTSLRMGEMIVHPKLRAALGLDGLPSNTGTTEPGQQKPLVELKQITELDRIPPVSETPAVICLPPPKEEPAQTPEEETRSCMGTLMLEAMANLPLPDIWGVNGEVLVTARPSSECDAQLMLSIVELMVNDHIDIPRVRTDWMIQFYDTWAALS